MIGTINLQSAAKDKRSPRWVRLVYAHTRWKRVEITVVTTKEISDQLQNIPYGALKNTLFLVNLGIYKGINKRITLEGLFLGVPSIRSIYSLRYVPSRHLRRNTRS